MARDLKMERIFVLKSLWLVIEGLRNSEEPWIFPTRDTARELGSSIHRFNKSQWISYWNSNGLMKCSQPMKTPQHSEGDIGWSHLNFIKKKMFGGLISLLNPILQVKFSIFHHSKNENTQTKFLNTSMFFIPTLTEKIRQLLLEYFFFVWRLEESEKAIDEGRNDKETGDVFHTGVSVKTKGEEANQTDRRWEKGGNKSW